MTIRLLIADDFGPDAAAPEGSVRRRRRIRGQGRAQRRRGAGRAGTLRPDVITLDINMPVMDGMTCLSRIMVQRPKPVVMVSSLTAAGAEATLAGAQPRRGRFRPQAGRHDLAVASTASCASCWPRCAPPRRRGCGASHGLRGRLRGRARTHRRRAPARRAARPSAGARARPDGHGADRRVDRRAGHAGGNPAAPAGRTFPGRCWSRSTCRAASPACSPAA